MNGFTTNYMMFAAMFGFLPVIEACSDANPVSPTDAATNNDTAVADDVAQADVARDDDVVVGPVCIGGRDFCLNNIQSARCNADGTAIEATTDCEGSSACEPLTGLCRATLCEPDSEACVDTRRVQRCAADGSTWGEPVTCTEGLTCRDGRCRACTENAVECLGPLAYRRCAEDAQAWGGELPCPFDHRCTGEGADAGCKRCDSERTCVNDARVRERCTSGLVTWQEETVCPVDQACADGRCQACTPDASECLSETTFRRCADDGSRWGNTESCDVGEACFDTRCLPYACSPRILFLVDFSGSMSSYWTSVRQSIAAIVGANPDIRFGLKTFPDAQSWSCDVSATLEIPFDTGLGTAFDAWFLANPPSGATPLAAGLDTMDANADAIFGNLGGTLIVLSDGEDTCYSGGSSTPIRPFLASKAASLRLNHNVPVYAIGYSFGGNPGELDVIANNGGTNFTAHIPAGNESELIGVLGDIIDRVKFCDLGATP